jgi:hypothetical protein
MMSSPACAQVVLEVTQSPPPPWQPGTQVVVDVRARNLSGPTGAVEFTYAPRPVLAPEFNEISPLQFGCAPGSFGAINEPPIPTWRLGVIPAGGTATCSVRFQVDADATPGSAEWAFAGLSQTQGMFFDPSFVIAPFGIAPAPASVPALSPWSVAALALTTLLLVSFRIRPRTGSRRCPAAAMPTRRGSA